MWYILLSNGPMLLAMSHLHPPTPAHVTPLSPHHNHVTALSLHHNHVTPPLTHPAHVTPPSHTLLRSYSNLHVTFMSHSCLRRKITQAPYMGLM